VALGVAEPTPLLVEAFRWFAIMTLVITYIMVRALWSGNEAALRFVLEGYLLGDLLYFVALVQFVNTLGGTWAGGAIFAAGVTIFLATVRVIYLGGMRQVDVK
jgi:type II secretory pathway component PulF